MRKQEEKEPAAGGSYRKEEEIELLIQDRAHHRVRGEWEQADIIKLTLWEEYNIELMDQANVMATTWIPRRLPEIPKIVEWSAVVLPPPTTDTRAFHEKIPFIINTVNTPYYRQRYKETLEYLEQWQSGAEADIFRLEQCDLLNLQTHASVGAKGILMQGWKTVLIPSLLEQLHDSSKKDIEFALVAEDDIRFPEFATPAVLRNVCSHVFASNPNLLVLSLGHAWSTLQKEASDLTADRDLLSFLRRKPVGIHATTLLALRLPDGVLAVQKALDEATKLQHLDQFLFHSTQHDLPLAISDPPLAGWMEVEQSLTKSGSGHRRLGGGRLGHLPTTGASPGVDIQWIQRRVKERAVDD